VEWGDTLKACGNKKCIQIFLLENRKWIQQTFLQCGFVRRGFDYARENKCEQLFVEREKFDYARENKCEQLFVEREKFDYACENKCEQLFVEREKFDYMRSAKHAVETYEKCPCCLKS
jgi:hypothetical protein